MKSTHRFSALALALLCLLPSMLSCGKKGLSVDKEQALTNLQASAAQAEAKKDALKKEQIAANKAIAEQTAAKPAESKPAVEEVPLENPDEYAAPAKTPEVYDPAAENRALKVFGAAVSDGEYIAVYGECAAGALVSVKNDQGTFTVQSFGGNFAARVKNPAKTASLEITQSANGTQIGDAVVWQGSVQQPDYGGDWGVWLGGDNQGFFHKMIPDFTHTNLLDTATLDSIRTRYASRTEALKSVGDGCEMIVLLIPSAMTVYPELVPAEVALPGEGESRFDQLAKVLTEAGVTVIDVRETFAAHKNDALPLYYRYDSHWADYGSYLAYVELFDYISDRYPDAAPRKFNEFTWEWGYYTGGDIPYYFDIDHGGAIYEYTYLRKMNFDPIASVKGLIRYTDGSSLAYRSYSDEIVSGKTYNSGRDKLPDLYVYRNSYGAGIYDLILERSDKITFNPTFSYTYNIAQIKKTVPDYVVYIMSEWDFGNIIDN
ncbi:MAG: hypothetical protein IKU40_06925 [Clostridia bacterium]|nr:hypothetical protein [Clostridia bacterium]